MKYMVFKDYFTGEIIKKVKLNAKCQDVSLSYQLETLPRSYREKLVVRSYFDNEILQKIDPPTGRSYEFYVSKSDNDY